MIFDSHFHIIDKCFPIIENNGFIPEEFTLNQYTSIIEKYDIKGGAIVSGSLQEFDQNYIFDALNKLDKNYVGVINLKHDTSFEEILKLNQKRIKGVRFNLYRGGSEKIDYIEKFAHDIYNLCGMHIELYIDSPKIKEYYNVLKNLPKISIDHLGLKYKDHEFLLKLVEDGAHVKATGFMRVDFDVKHMMRNIYEINHNALMFGTDLPGTRASRIFNDNDINIIKNNFSELEQENIFFKNALDFYNS